MYILDLIKNMHSNQLFKIIPPIEYVEKIVKLFGPSSIDNNYQFSLQNLKNKNILEKILEEKEELKKYYINCKYKKYIENLTYKRLITILRQLLRYHNYIIKSTEKYSNGTKYLLYHIEKNNTKVKKDYGLVMNFD